MRERIAILDFSSQYTQLIARRVREAKVYSEIFPYYVELNKLLENPPKGIILSGGPASVYEDKAPVCNENIYQLNIPILGYLLWCSANSSNFRRKSNKDFSSRVWEDKYYFR